MGNLHDVHFNDHVFIGGEVIKYNLVTQRFEIYDLDGKLLLLDNEDARLESAKVDRTQTIIGIDLADNITLGEFRIALGNATTSVAGFNE